MIQMGEGHIPQLIPLSTLLPGGVSQFLLISFPCVPISQIKALSLPSFVLHFGEPGSQISLKIPNYKPLKIITMALLNNIMG